MLINRYILAEVSAFSLSLSLSLSLTRYVQNICMEALQTFFSFHVEIFQSISILDLKILIYTETLLIIPET